MQPFKNISVLDLSQGIAGPVCAGILARQEQELKDAYAEVGLQLQVANAEEGWILMTAQKPAKSMA